MMIIRAGAFLALHEPENRRLGHGRFADGTGYVVLQQDADAQAASLSHTS